MLHKLYNITSTNEIIQNIFGNYFIRRGVTLSRDYKKITMNMEDRKEDVVLPNLMVSESEINPNLYFNASNLKDGVKERTDMTKVDDYLMNKENYQPEIKLPYMLECTSRLSYQKPSDSRLYAERLSVKLPEIIDLTMATRISFVFHYS